MPVVTTAGNGSTGPAYARLSLQTSRIRTCRRCTHAEWWGPALGAPRALFDCDDPEKPEASCGTGRAALGPCSCSAESAARPGLRVTPGCALSPEQMRRGYPKRSGSVDCQVVGERLVVAEGVRPVHQDGVRAAVKWLEHHEEAVHDGRLRRTRDAGIEHLQTRIAGEVEEAGRDEAVAENIAERLSIERDIEEIDAVHDRQVGAK